MGTYPCILFANMTQSNLIDELENSGLGLGSMYCKKYLMNV